MRFWNTNLYAIAFCMVLSPAFGDNMEGIAVESAPGGGVIATIISDDTVRASQKLS